MRSSLLVFLLLFRRVVSRINNGSILFHAKVIKDQILIIPIDWRIQLCTICHASSFRYFKYGSRTDIIYKAKQKISIKGNFIYSTIIYRVFIFYSRSFSTIITMLYIFWNLSFIFSVKIFFPSFSNFENIVKHCNKNTPSIKICMPSIKGIQKLNTLAIRDFRHAK